MILVLFGAGRRTRPWGWAWTDRCSPPRRAGSLPTEKLVTGWRWGQGPSGGAGPSGEAVGPTE